MSEQEGRASNHILTLNKVLFSLKLRVQADIVETIVVWNTEPSTNVGLTAIASIYMVSCFVSGASAADHLFLFGSSD